MSRRKRSYRASSAPFTDDDGDDDAWLGEGDVAGSVDGLMVAVASGTEWWWGGWTSSWRNSAGDAP